MPLLIWLPRPAHSGDDERNDPVQNEEGQQGEHGRHDVAKKTNAP